MDSITTAILAAISAGVLSKTAEIAAIESAYIQVKEMIAKKFGAKSKVINSVKELEAKPTSAARKEMVKEEMASVNADQDKELLQAAQALLKEVKALLGGSQIIQTAIGDQNIQIAGDSNVVNIAKPNRLPGDPTIDAPPPPKKKKGK